MKKIVIIIILPLVLLTACVDSLEDWNVDQKRASEVPAAAFDDRRRDTYLRPLQRITPEPSRGSATRSPLRPADGAGRGG